MSVTIVAMVDFSEYGNHTVLHLSNTSTSREIGNRLTHDQNITKYNWSPTIQGGILGAGFFGYVLFLIMGGKLAETFGPKIMLIIGTFVSSFAMTVTPLTADVSPYFLMFIQCVRGIAQSLMFPSMTVLSASWFPKAERGLLSGLALSGYILGLLLAGILSSLMCDSVAIGGWPAVFYTFGGLGIFISILQLLFLSNMPKDDPRISRAELKYILENQENELTAKRPAVPWRRILSSMPAYALFLCTFGKYWLCIHFLSVHPTFLATILHMPMKENGVLVSVPYVISMFCNVVSSILSSFLNSKNYLSVSLLRKFWHLLGSLNALNTALASIAGLILPVVCGILTDEEQTVQQWNKFFILSIVIVMSTAIFFCIFGSADVQSYNFVTEDVPPKSEEKSKNRPKAVEIPVALKFPMPHE